MSGYITEDYLINLQIKYNELEHEHALLINKHFVKKSCCKEYDSTPVKGVYHNPKCKNWVMVY